MSGIKRIIAAASAAAFLCCTLLSGCGKSELPVVNLSVWGSGEDSEFLRKAVESFGEYYSGEAQFNITISEESEITCKETVLADPAAAADVFCFAADQFDDLYRAGALHEITIDADRIIEENGGEGSGAVRCAERNGALYAYPATASNGYFLYYNKAYFSEEDIRSFDRMLDIAADNGKKVSMDLSSGWYIYSFFKGAGLNVEMKEDGSSNICDWNSVDKPIKGIDVAEAMLKIAKHKGFASGADEEFKAGIADGTIIAGINGTWNAHAVQEAFGDNYAAAKLPEYTAAGQSIQMCSFAGYKLLGVNAYSENAEWAMRLAQWITNEENQTLRFRMRGEGPSNINAAASPDVQASPAIVALGEQSEYGYIQNVAETFWTPTYIFGTTIAGGNTDNIPLQQLLDDMVHGIEAVKSEQQK